MELILLSSSKGSRQKVERDHYWYDQIEKKMLYARGGRMEFQYDSVNKRTYPVVVDEYVQISGNNFQDIVDWVKKKASDYQLDVVGRSGDKNLRVEVPALFFNEVIADLRRSGIAVEYEPKEYTDEIDKIRKNEYEKADRRSRGHKPNSGAWSHGR